MDAPIQKSEVENTQMKMNLSLASLGKVALPLALALALSAPAGATLFDVSASLDGPQANAGGGTGSPGTGTLVGSFDSDTNALTWNIQWNGLSGTPTLMHFHGPATPAQNAGVQVGTGVAGPPVIGNAILSDPQEADLLAGLWYLNLHTTTFAGGEIRGQVSATIPPEPMPGPGLFLVLPVAVAGGFVLNRRWKRHAGT